MKAKISEVFSSIQGEGKYVGVKQIFVRFCECNLNCDWCDTPNTTTEKDGQYREYSRDELSETINSLWEVCHSVSLTGGEPLLQKDFLKEFLGVLKSQKKKTYLETNGILYKVISEVVADLDIISMDIKLPSSTKCGEYWHEHEEFLRIANAKEVFIKAVISNGTIKEDVVKAVDLVKNVDSNILFVIQPNSLEMSRELINKCVEFRDYCAGDLKDIRVIPQVHKIIGVR